MSKLFVVLVRQDISEDHVESHERFYRLSISDAICHSGLNTQAHINYCSVVALLSSLDCRASKKQLYIAKTRMQAKLY